MDLVNEKSSSTIALAFTDETGAAVTPSSARYRIDDVAAGTQIKDWTAFVPTGSGYDLEILDTENAILTAANDTEMRRVTVEFTYGVANKKGTGEYLYAVKNLPKYP